MQRISNRRKWKTDLNVFQCDVFHAYKNCRISFKKLYKTFIYFKHKYYKHGFISRLLCNKILSRCIWVTVDGVLDSTSDSLDSLGDYTLQFTITHTHTHTDIHSSVHSDVFTSRYSVAASNGGRSPSSVGSRTVPGFIYQLLTETAHNWTSTTHQPTQLNWLLLFFLVITSRHGPYRRTHFSIIAV
jgi:hypothetical protein